MCNQTGQAVSLPCLSGKFSFIQRSIELIYLLSLLEFVFELRVTLQCIWCLFAVCVERRRQYVKLRREFFEISKTVCTFTVECGY